MVWTRGESHMHEYRLHGFGLIFCPAAHNRMRDTNQEAFVLISIQANYHAEHMCSILWQHLHINFRELLPRSGCLGFLVSSTSVGWL